MMCPFCREQPEDDLHVAYHLLHDHIPSITGMPYSGSEGGRVCWCGQVVRGNRDFALHLRANGGLYAHLLACQLGVHEPEEE